MAATIARVPAPTEQISYADLYARWEKGNWRATEIDFSQDRVDWHERMSPEQRRGALWLYTLFFHGEDSVADTLSPFIDRSEEHTSELQSRQYLVCRLLLEKKNNMLSSTTQIHV